jgi:hypothetical protein
MPNELELGTPRVGDFIGFYPDTPHVKVTLERSEKGISFTILWSDPDSDHARWFTEDTGGIRIPALPDPLPVPNGFCSSTRMAPYLLIRCWPRGSTPI